jgi:ubiquinone/menaquinone biosynthesis C-methylase UbiE
MRAEAYTPGHSENATDFMSKRSIETHGQFFIPYLVAGVSVLDCGCGPGSITFGIAERVYPGTVAGIDAEAFQIDRASTSAAQRALTNIKFQTADCYLLPLQTESFDRAFSHALFEHLSDPIRALKEIHRVLKPGGIVGLCSPDWGGFLLSPSSGELRSAVSAYTILQTRNGGDVEAGRKLGVYLTEVGFAAVHMGARYECYSSLRYIGEYLALQLEREGDAQSAEVFRKWSQSEAGLFAVGLCDWAQGEVMSHVTLRFGVVERAPIWQLEICDARLAPCFKFSVDMSDSGVLAHSEAFHIPPRCPPYAGCTPHPVLPRTTFFSRHGFRSWLSSKTRIVSRPTRGTSLRFTTSSVSRRTVQRERPSGGGPHASATMRCRCCASSKAAFPGCGRSYRARSKPPCR